MKADICRGVVLCFCRSDRDEAIITAVYFLLK